MAMHCKVASSRDATISCAARIAPRASTMLTALPTAVFAYRRASLFLILSTASLALSMRPFSRAFRTVDSPT